MRATVTVTLKREVLDPQGEAVRKGLVGLGLVGVGAVRIGKLIEIELPPDMAPEDARTAMARAAEQLLANPVVEDWCVALEPEAVRVL